MEANILHNGNKGVTNYIMGFRAFIAMNTSLEMDTHRVNGMHAHITKDTCN
jgi:hypothetical protein